MISESYRQLNTELHGREPRYGTSGHKHAAMVASLARAIGAGSILDYGCGKQTLRSALLPTGLVVTGYDPAIEALADAPEPAPLVVCTDVLEHIEPGCLDAVLDDLRRLALTSVLLAVATVPARKMLADGRNAHLIVEPIDWWLPKLMSRWRLANVINDGADFLFVGGRR